MKAKAPAGANHTQIAADNLRVGRKKAVRPFGCRHLEGRKHSVYRLEATRGLCRGQGGTEPNLNNQRQVGGGRGP